MKGVIVIRSFEVIWGTVTYLVIVSAETIGGSPTSSITSVEYDKSALWFTKFIFVILVFLILCSGSGPVYSDQFQ